MTRAHAAGDRVVLTVTCFDQHSLDAITSDPNAPARLSAALIAAVRAKNLDGVNFDFEGEGSADQVGLTNLITKVSAALHVADPHWQVTMAVYASAAGDSRRLLRHRRRGPGTRRLLRHGLRHELEVPAECHLAAVRRQLQRRPGHRVVPEGGAALARSSSGCPTTATTGRRRAGRCRPTATGLGVTARRTRRSRPSGHPTYWDPVTDTPWTSYQVGTQWHTTFFDDPTSMALKAQLANYFHIAGVGIWALGMDGNDPAMLAALLGNAPAAKDVSTGPPPGTGFVSVATFGGTTNVALTPITPPPPGGSAQLVGFLGGFAHDRPGAGLPPDRPAAPGVGVQPAAGVLRGGRHRADRLRVGHVRFPVPTPSATTTTTAAPGTTDDHVAGGHRPRPTTPPTTTTTTRPPATTTTTTTTSTTTTTTGP